MATSVKMRERDKERLDRLQGEIMARRGHRVAQQDILSWLLDLGEGAKARLGEDGVAIMSPKEMAALLRLPVHTGVRTREEDIDDVVAAEVR